MKQFNYDLEKYQTEIYAPYRSFPLCQRKQDNTYSLRTLDEFLKHVSLDKKTIFWDSKDDCFSYCFIVYTWEQIKLIILGFSRGSVLIISTLETSKRK